jgi:hypothetical protein
MKTGIKKAAALTAARVNQTQQTAYHKGDNPSSRLKEKIGYLLLCLLTNRQGKDGWQRFDRLLRRFYAWSGEGFSGLQSTNSAQGVSR